MIIPCIQKSWAMQSRHAGVKNLSEKFWDVTKNMKLDKMLTLPFGDSSGCAPGVRIGKQKSNVQNAVDLSEISIKHVCVLTAQNLCI
jgi:hypothetical protein